MQRTQSFTKIKLVTMIKEVKTKNMRRKSNCAAILTIKKVYNKQEVQRFIKEWEEVTKKGSPVKTVMLNSEVIEFKGFIRKMPRIAHIPKAVRKDMAKHIEKLYLKIMNDSWQYEQDLMLHGMAFRDKNGNRVNPMEVKIEKVTVKEN